MLKYLISTTELLVTAAIYTALVLAYIRLAYAGGRKLAAYLGCCVGIAASAVVAILKNARIIDPFLTDLILSIIFVGALVIFLVFAALRKPLPRVGGAVSLTALALITADILAACLPEYMAYPYTIWLNENSMMSTNLLFKIIGMILGLALMLIVCVAVNRGAVRLPRGLAFWVMTAALAVNAVKQGANIINILVTKRYIRSTKFLFNIIKFSSNHSDLFIWLTMAAALIIPAVLLIKSLKVSEPYDNPAQKRKIKKKWLVIKRWSATVISGLAVSALCMTAVKAYINKPIELSPVEHAPEADGNIYVSFEMVEDGHLHRFGYNTDKGKEIRFIVIKKPNSSAYGIGLDACDICGETGYYEKDGQVVCKLCDVVMNINTIGFKGGCNPIVIDYKIENGQIVVPISTLLEHENEFK